MNRSTLPVKQRGKKGKLNLVMILLEDDRSHPGNLERNNGFENFFPGGNKLNTSKSLNEMLAAIFSSYDSS